MNKHKALSLAGLAARCGKAKSGEFSAEKSIKSGKAFLVVAAADASENTRKKFKNSCAYYHIPFRVFADKDSLGASIGKQERAVVAIEEPGLANAMIRELDKEPVPEMKIEEIKMNVQ